MRDIDTLITTLSAYQRLKLTENSHKPGWEEEQFDSLILGLHSEKYELLAEIADPDSTPEKIWREAADVANYAAMLASEAVRRKYGG